MVGRSFVVVCAWCWLWHGMLLAAEPQTVIDLSGFQDVIKHVQLKKEIGEP